MKNIEQLKKEANEIRNSLNTLKNNVSLSDKEKKSQAETFKAQVDTMRQDIQSKIDALANKTDNKSKKEKEEAETLLDSLRDITNLYISIINSPDSESKTQPSTNEKNIFVKAKDWIWEQRDNVWDSQKRSTEWWKNTLRTTGFIATWVWAIALTYKWLKKLWNWAFSNDNTEDKSDDRDKRKSKDEDKEPKMKSFWKTGLWRFLEWTGIVTATWWWIFGISKLLWWKKDTKTEVIQQWWAEISEEMFQQLLYMEWDQDFVAKVHKNDFWEDFVTWPYGMVYKHIDENWNLLNNIVSFKDGERVSKDWAEKNARAYYNKRAKEWSDLLKSKWYKYSQDMLDALVSASWWTEKSVRRLKEFVLSHWDDKDAIFNFMSKFATTAAWNWKILRGLVIRRDFEANWFKGNKEPLSDYQKKYRQDRHYA